MTPIPGIYRAMRPFVITAGLRWLLDSLQMQDERRFRARTVAPRAPDGDE